MMVLLCSIRATAFRIRAIHHARSVATARAKKEGDISAVFVGLSGEAFKPLPERFAQLKARLIHGHEDELQASWDRLLGLLRDEIPLIAAVGPSIVPEITFSDVDNPSEAFKSEHRKRGVAVIRNVIPEQEALQYKTDIQTYIRRNPNTKAFPADNPQVFELYWSPSQIRARSHPNLLKAQKFMMQFWHSADPDANISNHPTIYADRLRIRLPGDSKFALGPHVDGGSVERWEEGGYGLGRVYEKVFSGNWEELDPFESSCRLPVRSDLYNGAGACSMFRIYQGWLAMSHTGPGEGTLLVNPLLKMATAYTLLRPFFSPKRHQNLGGSSGDDDFLHSANWKLDKTPDSWLQGASPGHAQELTPLLHPHLDLNNSMVSIPRVAPGDYVVWHCDTIHAVDKVHNGSADSSVMYIPTCPLTEQNAQYLARQRDAFVDGTPGPDFPGGRGEAKHIGRATAQHVFRADDEEGARAFGLEAWDSTAPGLSKGQREVMDKANKILELYD